LGETSFMRGRMSCPCHVMGFLQGL